MFNSLRGIVTHKDSNLCHLSTQGIEWEIHTTRTSIAQLPEAGKEARLFVHLYHREDQMKLYGFTTAEERALFFELLKVDGLGPRLAQKILSAITQTEFFAAVEREDLQVLESLPGLGKKTAQKIVLHMKGKIPATTETDPDSLVGDLTGALANMGFDKKAAREAVVKAAREVGDAIGKPDEREQEIFRRALAFVSKEGKRK